MISGVEHEPEDIPQRRLLVVGHQEQVAVVASDLRSRLSDWTIGTCGSYLSGIAELARRPAKAVLAFVDPSIVQLDNAVAGLREAAGSDARLILCCNPECEPIARSVLQHGADDYILIPLDDSEVESAIGLHQEAPPSNVRLTDAPAATMDEFVQLAAVLEHLGDHPVSIFERIATLVRGAFHARGVTMVVEGTVVTSGDAAKKPVLTAPLSSLRGKLGQLSLARRQHDAYTPADVLKLTHYAAVIAHLIEAARKQRRLRKLASTDECSGLPNRRFFNERVEAILQQATAEHFHVTLLLFDVDDFKTYNDRYGHDVGDEIIRSTGELFRKHCREQDIVARFGGDEFAVCFWDADGPREVGSKEPESALVVLDRVKAALQTQTLDHLGRSGVGQLTISGGVATFPWDGTTRKDLLKKADEALLAAKRAGKNRIFLIGQDDTH